MFKKKSSDATPRARNRVASNDAPRSAPVFSYHASRSTDIESRARGAAPNEVIEIRQRPRWWTIWRRNLGQRQVLTMILGVIMLLIVVGLNTNPKIVVVDDSGSHLFLQSVTVYQQAAQKLFARSVANKNKLTINTSAIAAQLQQNFSELRTVSISLPVFGRQPIVYVQPATPQLILATESSGKFAVDSTGRALASVTDQTKLPNSMHLPLVVDQSGISLSLGSIALPSDSVAFIAQVQGQFQAKGVAADSWTLANGANELDVKVSGAPYFVKFNLHADAREEAGTFLAVKQSLDGSKTVPAQYVDVRVAGRAYYR